MSGALGPDITGGDRVSSPRIPERSSHRSLSIYSSSVHLFDGPSKKPVELAVHPNRSGFPEGALRPDGSGL